MEKKKCKLNLLLKILIGIAAGLLCGFLLPGVVNRIPVTFSNIYSTYLVFVIPLMILAYVTITGRISYDMVAKNMCKTGLDMHKNYRETSEGGLAATYQRKGGKTLAD